jgi:hypothetical protein
MFGPKAMKGFFGGGHRPGFGHGPRRGRMFERGDLKYVILDLLEDGPSHGYAVIRNLEERSRGFYSPSPGTVYPTLQLLEDMGHVTSTQQDGKKIYAITTSGAGLGEAGTRRPRPSCMRSSTTSWVSASSSARRCTKERWTVRSWFE